MYSLRQSAALFWGKLRRQFLVKLRKGRVEEKLQRRRGACSRCGACCKLLFNCPAFDDSDGSPKCLIYHDRPGVCGLFPLDEKDLRERDIVMPDKKCGFYFEDGPPPTNGSGASHPVSMPLRWGPPGRRTGGEDGKGDGRPFFLKGAFAILWAYFRKPKSTFTSNGNGNGSAHSSGGGNGTPQ